MAIKIKKITSVCFHRNGMVGNGYTTVQFLLNNKKRMLAVVFSGRAANIAILDLDTMESHRYEDYEKEMRQAVEEYADGRDFDGEAEFEKSSRLTGPSK